MSRPIRVVSLSAAFLFGIAGICAAQYGGANSVRTQPMITEQVRAAVRTLLLQFDHLLEDMEVDLAREPLSERLMQTAYDVRDELEHLAASVERGVDYNHAVRDFQEFDMQWHRLTRQASRFAADDRHLQRNLSRVSQTDSELHRLLRVPVPVDVREVRALGAGLERASQHLREDVETDLIGLRYQRVILDQAVTLEESTEHLVASIDRGVDVQHVREDFSAIDEAWLQLAESLRQLSSMRFDHVLRAAANVATAEGQLRAALGLEPDPNQFTCFRPAPSDVRRTLPYASNGSPVVIPSGWRVAPTPPGASAAIQPGVNYPPNNAMDPGLSFALSFLFGGNSHDSKAERPHHVRVEAADEEQDHEHEHDRVNNGFGVRSVAPANRSAANAGNQAAVPPKPVDAAVQAKIDKNLAKLSADGRAAALAQRTCPVKGELLGIHGVPIKVKIKDKSGTPRDVFVCCDDCEDELQDHPKRYMDRVKGQE